MIINGIVSEITDEGTFWVRYDVNNLPAFVEFYSGVITENLEYFQVGIPIDIDTEEGTVKLVVHFWTKEEIEGAKEKAKELESIF